MFLKKILKESVQDTSTKQNNAKYEIIVFKETLATQYSNRNLGYTDFKPVIRLKNLKTCFRIPYNGYLYIEADYGELLFEDNSLLFVDKSINKIYLDENISIKIINTKNLKDITFVQS